MSAPQTTKPRKYLALMCAISLLFAAAGCTTMNDADHDGYEFGGDDCDDADPTVHPGATEFIDGRDQDCDGLVDEGTAVFDDDGDGFTEIDGDCNDSNSLVYPGATEVYADGAEALDDDCDGSIDEGTEGSDDDHDGFTELEGDCDDESALIHPIAEEVCGDAVDNDCSGMADDRDVDGDGYVDELCGGSDCDDDEAEANPDSPEVVGDLVDNDCNGSTDEDWELDTIVSPESGLPPDADDLNGYNPEASFIAACNDASAYSSYSAYPAGTMLPITFVNIANTAGDGAATDARLLGGIDVLNGYFVDLGLSFTIVDVVQVSNDDYVDLTQAEGTTLRDQYSIEATSTILVVVTDTLSVLDTDDIIKGWAENPNSDIQYIAVGKDFLRDETLAHEMGHYFGLPHTFHGHDGMDPELVNGSNCDDAGDRVCDTPADPGPSWHNTASGCDYNSSTCVATCGDDANGDQYDPDVENVMSYYHCGDQTFSTIQVQQMLCVLNQLLDTIPIGTDDDGDGFLSSVDCDDDDPEVNPDAIEVCDGVDNDCDGARLGETDADGDGWMVCEGDCDDTSDRYYPGAPETDCVKNFDYNCDGSAGYDDVDGDGWAACDDCDDSNSSANPSATEGCMDSVDSDCDGDPQNGCGLIEGMLCGLSMNGDGAGCVFDGVPYDPGSMCPTGWDQVEVSGGGDNFYACAVPYSLAECDGDTFECDPDAVPTGAACGLWDNSDSEGVSCSATAGFDLDVGRCPSGFDFYGFYNNGYSSGEGFATCLADGGGASESSIGGFVCDLNHEYYDSTPSVTCPGGYQAEFASCPSNCTALGPADMGLSSGNGWVACVCD